LKRSISQPRWNSDSSLFFADDISGYWQLFRVHEDGTVTPVVSGLEETDHAGSEFKLGRLVNTFAKSKQTGSSLTDFQLYVRVSKL
jgi:hypothetical protein